MRIFTLDTLADHWEQVASGMEAAFRASEQDSLQNALRTAVSLSGGLFSLRQLAAMGHPYSLRKPNLGIVGGDAAVINVQTGDFRAAWDTEATRSTGNALTSLLYNDSEEGEYLDGTMRMIRRPIMERVDSLTITYRQVRAATALYKLLS